MKDEIVRGMVALLRRCVLVVLGLMLVLFCVNQYQQRLLRQQVERLHAEILVLQLHPGNFTDLQRLGREWGAYTRYDGACTAQHCSAEITLEDLFLSKDAASTHPWLSLLFAHQNTPTLWAYRLMGGRPTKAYADLRVRDDRMWRVTFGLYVWNYSGSKGRNEGHPYAVATSINFGPRLVGGSGEVSPAVLQQGFHTWRELNCSGCEYVSASINTDTPAALVQRFHQINFNCMTRLFACRHPADLAPTLWDESLKDTVSERHGLEDMKYCDATSTVLAREADDILLVEVLAPSSIPATPADRDPRVNVRVVKAVKNGRTTLPGEKLVFVVDPRGVRSGDGTDAPLETGKQYFVLYDHPHANEFFQENRLRPCHALPHTDANVAEVTAGIAMDASTGEPY